MRKLIGLLAPVLLFVAYTTTASAGNEKLVQSFYDFLSNPASESHAMAAREAMADDWQSIGDYSGRTKSADEFIKQIGGFGKLIPDLNWVAEEMIVSGNRVVVRGRASGTPQGPLFGVDGQGKSFQIMSIDIHVIENQKIAQTFHVEDWSGALRQLSTK